MKKTTFIIILLLGFTAFSETVSAQHITSIDKKQLARKEDSLRHYADSMINAQEPTTRFRSDSTFTKTFVRALLVKNSFYHPFETVETVSKLYAPDSTFRIFSWQLKKDEYMYLQKGVIQMRTSDGSLKIFPLYDQSMFTGKPNDSVRNNKNWIGAIYYKIIEKNWQGKNYYTLLGFDDFTISSNRKWMEVLTFNEKGEPEFGGPFFTYKEDSVKKPTEYRFNIEYKKDARTTFNYNPELDMVIYDHLISETEEPEKKRHLYT